MQLVANKKGFTLIELMIATLIMVIGLVGAAAMQIQALNGIFLSNTEATASSVALTWTEWLFGLTINADQSKIPYTNTVSPSTRVCRENFVYLSHLDANVSDTMASYNPAKIPSLPFTEFEMPRTSQALADLFNGSTNFTTTKGQSLGTAKFRKAGATATDFAAKDMPPPPPAGAHIYLRIAANVPVVNTTTIEVAVLYTTGFTKAKGATLRLILGGDSM